ncbi:hypothetical protein L873DRAFT_1794294 [Choiromyces venosus 120613-1]|uniref:NADP-dependent oxidoreductase domain-containing protein n=1 Tax=Choiromyces venosus 120613-1 TaxID=1336337 RepID=A0A3N4J559_9PEZI|nr:hypothetical protein L873DRAFT_1794294 [Choiromyces venosus 120613-1]
MGGFAPRLLHNPNNPSKRALLRYLPRPRRNLLRPPLHSRGFQALSMITPLAKKYNLTLPEISFRWLTHHSALRARAMPENDGVIMAVSSLEQCRANVKDLEEGELPEEILEGLEKAWEGCTTVCPT